jgi:hypothetical protein
LEEAVADLLRRRILELLPPTPRGPTKAIRPAKLSPDHWIHCRHTPEWSGSCRGHMASKAATRAPPPARRHHLRSTRAAPTPPFTDISDAPTLHHLHAQPPLQDCRCRTRPPSLGPTALRHKEGGGRGGSQGPSASQAAHTASRAPPVTPPPPTSCHRARSPHQPPLTAFQAALTRSTRHAAFTIQLPPRATDVLTSCCNWRGRQRKGEQPRPTGGLPGCCPTRHATTATPRAAVGRARTDAHCCRVRLQSR